MVARKTAAKKVGGITTYPNRQASHISIFHILFYLIWNGTAGFNHRKNQ
jgi:hypothetical protein